MDPYKYIKNRIPGLAIYPIVESGKEYFRLQFGQPSNISPDYKGKKTQFFPRTEQGLKDLAAEYNRRKPFVIPSLSRADAAKAGAKGGVSLFLNEKKKYTQDLVDFIQKNSSDPKYKVQGGVTKLFNDALKFFKKDKKYTSVPEGFSKGPQSMEFIKGNNFQLPRKYDMIENFKTSSNYGRHNKFIKSFIATQLLENNPNFINIRDMATRFYTTDVDRKELLKENKALVKATSGFLGKNNIRKDTPAGEYLRNKGFDFDKKLYQVIQFRTLEQDIIDRLKDNISNAERVRLENSLAVIQRNRGTVFKKLKAEFPNLTKGNAMVLEHATPQGLINTGTFYPKSFMLKAQYVPQAFNQFKNTQFDTPLIKLVYQYNNETDPSIKQSLKSEIQDLRKNFNNRTKVDGKGYLDDMDFKFGQKVSLIDKTPTVDLLTDEGSIKQYVKNVAHSNAYFSSLNQKTVGIQDKRFPIDKLKLDIPESKTFNLFLNDIRADAAADGPICKIVKSKKQDGGTVSCVQAVEDAIEKNPQKLVQDASKIGKFKNAALGFLKSPGFKTFSAAGVAGAVGTGLVKAFRNDDPTTYLSNEDQQKNMLVDMATSPITTDLPRPDILDYQLPLAGALVAGSTAAVAPKTIKASKSDLRFASRSPGVEKKKPGNIKTGFRTLGRGLGVAASPGLLAPLAAMDITSQVSEGDSALDIATDPFNYLYPAFADQTPKMTRGLPSVFRKIANLGLGRVGLKVLSRAGLAGLGLSLGIQGYQALTDD